MLKLSKKEQEYLKGYAQALQDVMRAVTGEDTCGKGYGPIDFGRDEIHSAFNLKNGGRLHPLSDFKDIDEIKKCMVIEAADWVEHRF